MSTRDYVGERVLVWPENLDSTLPRGSGRRLPKRECVPKPTLKEPYEAAERAGLDPILEEGKKLPKRWWCSQGRIAVLKRGSKLRTLRIIAEELKRLRSEKKS